MTILELFDRPIAYHRVFVTLTGSVKAAVMLSQAVYWQKRATQADGWWYKTANEWTDETGLTRREQDTARKECGKYLKTDLRGVPATMYWQVDVDALSADLNDLDSGESTTKSADPVCRKAPIQFGGKRQSSLAESAKLVWRKAPNIKDTETTTETTTEINHHHYTRAREIQEVFKIYESEIGNITEFLAEKLKDALTVYPEDWIIAAIKESSICNKRSWKYIEAILRRWQTEGYQADTRDPVPVPKTRYRQGQTKTDQLGAFRELTKQNKDPSQIATKRG